ncbi:pilus assembly protein TadG-related protein [Bacillus sp. FJAT-50079]|uniref:pilus assembly protein TadG-related protein n=1 Tax=Bacillus sp. FJAT-50079 TaxID=2833577 RepID=UPI001BC9C424|nr:pilus assembly protein TadG-related protein [Bacillus sp. FJAT-50079]MBS4210372.1 Tad domain-containing protein [Bacillus sp. FJAT-50079]
MKNESGNVIVFMLGLLSVMMILFVFVVNLTQVLAVKEKANTTAQQASLAATAVLYEEIWDSIDEYERTLTWDEDESQPETIAEKVEKQINQLRRNPAYSQDSDNEIKRRALNDVLTQELRSNDQLATKLERDIRFFIIPSMKHVAAATISENDGSVSGAEMTLFKEGRIYVEASNSVKAASYKNYFLGVEKKLFQQSAGPKIDFSSQLSIHQTIALD